MCGGIPRRKCQSTHAKETKRRIDQMIQLADREPTPNFKEATQRIRGKTKFLNSEHIADGCIPTLTKENNGAQDSRKKASKLRREEIRKSPDAQFLTRYQSLKQAPATNVCAIDINIEEGSQQEYGLSL